MDHDIVAGAAGQQFGVDDLAGIVDIVIDLDAEFALELFHQFRIDIVGPVVDIEDRFPGSGRDAGAQQDNARQQQDYPCLPPRCPRS